MLTGELLIVSLWAIENNYEGSSATDFVTDFVTDVMDGRPKLKEGIKIIQPFSIPNSQCPIPNAQCPMPNSQCPIPITNC